MTTLMTPTVDLSPDKLDTKERLLEAGMHEFAEHGFNDASIRRICARAEANAAAVNYHFGDKLRFYAEVLVTCHERASQRRPMPRLADNPDEPEERLYAWVRWFLDRLLVQTKAGPLGKLMAREMFAPTPAFEEVIRRSLLPINLGLAEIMIALLGKTDPKRVQLCLHSVLGQCLLYKHAEPAFERLERISEFQELPGPSPALLVEDLDSLARHITDFSLAGMGVRSGLDGEES